MTFSVIRGQGQGQEMTPVPFWDYFYASVKASVKSAVGDPAVGT